MKLFLDELQWSQKLADVPQVLRQKRINEIGEHFDRQFPTTASGNGWIQIDLSRTPDARHTIMGYLQSAGVAAVTVEPQDVVYLVGTRNFQSLALTRALELGEISLDIVEPSELFDRLDAALRQVQFPGGPVDDGPESELERALALNDLVSSGLLQPEDAGDDWFQRERDGYAERAAAMDREVREEIQRREEASFDPFYTESGDVW